MEVRTGRSVKQSRREVRTLRGRFVAFLLACFALMWGGRALRAMAYGRAAAELHVLIVGGGPSVRHNPVAIESNVRYVTKLLPPGTKRTTLFADGDPNRASVLYVDEPKEVPAEQDILDALLKTGEYEETGHLKRPNLAGNLDGASKHEDLTAAFTQLSKEATSTPSSVLLYFTGHGSPAKNDLDNNLYDLWGRNEGLTVRELSEQIARLPEETPVTIVMVQCFSGAFGNLLFEGGDPLRPQIHRDLAGFFATTKDRYAAGCSPAVNEADYHDFTSYFFAALTGKDRLGRTVTGADYNGDGRIEMNEAFCYTLIHDESIDVPICTSDVFLDHYAPHEGRDWVQTHYSALLLWASPAQRAALEALSDQLKLSGDNRVLDADRARYARRIADAGAVEREVSRHFRMVQEEHRQAVLRRWPELDSNRNPGFKAAHKDALVQIAAEIPQGKWQDFLDAEDSRDKAIERLEALEVEEAHNLRFLRLAQSIALAHRLEQGSDRLLKARYERLVEAEARVILPPVDNFRVDAAPAPTSHLTQRAEVRRNANDCGCSALP